MSSEVANRVEELMAGDGDNLAGALSLKILTWPHTGKVKEVGMP